MSLNALRAEYDNVKQTAKLAREIADARLHMALVAGLKTSTNKSEAAAKESKLLSDLYYAALKDVADAEENEVGFRTIIEKAQKLQRNIHANRSKSRKSRKNKKSRKSVKSRKSRKSVKSRKSRK
jgi:chorismate mutase